MITVADVIKENQNQPIIIKKAFSRDLCEPMREIIYEGQLKDVSASLQGMEVLEVGYSHANDVNCIIVYQG